MTDHVGSTPLRQIRARFDEKTITVYQAYRAEIAVPAARDGAFPAAFSRTRMTWIKPSFFWMMYRSGWASKPGQEHVLAITISREGFEWALRNSSWSHFEPGTHLSREEWQAGLDMPVRIQWDPERDSLLRQLPYRSLQIGLSGAAVGRYCDDWISDIVDITGVIRDIRAQLAAGRNDSAATAPPIESPYPLPPDIAARIGATGTP
jgi:hypothetical protein